MLVFSIIIGGMFPALQPDRANAAYSDIRGHAYEQVLSKWIDEGLLHGYADGTVQPDRTVTRAELMALINRSFGFLEPADIVAPDLTPGDWKYEQAVLEITGLRKSGNVPIFKVTVKLNKLTSN